MAAVKIDLPLVNSVKSGSVTVNKIMHGQNRIWPMFPIVLKLNDVYYDVTGIQNNEYVKTAYPKTRCILGKMVSAYQSALLYDYWQSFEICVSSLKDSVILRSGGGDSNKDSEIFQNGQWGQYIYWDYMALNYGGSGFNRLQLSLDNVSDIYDTTNLSNIWLIEAKTIESENKKILRVKPYGDSSWSVSIDKTAYTPNSFLGNYYYIGSQNNTDMSYFVNLYYIKVYDKSDQLSGFFHFKEYNNSYKLFDEVTSLFLDYHIHPSTNLPCDYSEYDDYYPDKYIDLNPELTNYFEVSGTITEGSDTFLRLVNNKTGIVLKGIKIES